METSQTIAPSKESQMNHENLSLVALNQLESYLECSICIALVCEPITISCGHSFCRVCLVKSLKKHKKKCPSCRAVCHVSAETAEENVMLKNICTSFFSKIYNERLAELEEEKASWSATLPIFYYNDCHFPGYNMGLHLFEPRYKLMMQRIVNTGRKFAFVPNFGTYVAKVGDVALVANLIDVQFLADGCVLLKAKLAERKVITEHYVEDGTQNLHFCSVGPLNDTVVPITDEVKTARIRELVLACHGILNGVLASRRREFEAEFGPPPITEGNFANVELFSLWMVSFSPLPTKTKYRLLSSTDTLGRLETVVNGFIQRLGRNILPVSSSSSSTNSASSVTSSSTLAHDVATTDGTDTSSNAATTTTTTTTTTSTTTGSTQSRRTVRAHAGPASQEHSLSLGEVGEMAVAFWQNAIERAQVAATGAGGDTEAAAGGGNSRTRRRDIRGNVRESSSRSFTTTPGTSDTQTNGEDETMNDPLPTLMPDTESSDEGTNENVLNYHIYNGDDDDDEDVDDEEDSIGDPVDEIFDQFGDVLYGDEDDDDWDEYENNEDEEVNGSDSMPELVPNEEDDDDHDHHLRNDEDHNDDHHDDDDHNDDEDDHNDDDDDDHDDDDDDQ